MQALLFFTLGDLRDAGRLEFLYFTGVDAGPVPLKCLVVVFASPVKLPGLARHLSEKEMCE